ncbi:protein phosphatase 1 regulatory subunit 35 [Oenanthe melanoleuca]|uniref:protein phosphatase 1 regulatory subunit 35 n=1 Tax=Oenanthe melanoleuca TaxID=2939378 RepID=UPI0024C14A74|nr:protein phosphatase 1 regulatory subunit 35 [Oenanthe melanoleuca]
MLGREATGWWRLRHVCEVSFGAWPSPEVALTSGAMKPRAGPVPPPPPPGGILRRGGREGSNRQVRFAPGPALQAEEEEDEEGALPTLATPTLHSSRGGPWGAPPEPFDAPRAAAALLGSSFAARSAMGGAAAAAMNVPQTQRLFRGLVSLAVPPPPGPRRGVQTPHTPTPQVPGPQLGALAGEGAVARGVGWPWLPPPAPPEPPRALPRPPGATFAMFQKLQQWGGH